MSQDDEERAELYRQQEKRRLAFGRSLLARLKAPAEPAETTKKNWAPLRRS